MKDFDEFMKQMNSKDWSLVVDSIADSVKDETKEQAIIHAALLINTTVLREYHNWVNAD